MSQLRVLVVGASVAGPMTAYWLAKAGARVTVIERFSQLRTAGQAIDIRTTGVTVMKKIPGMEHAVRDKTTTVSSISFVHANGSRVGTIAATGDPDQQSLVSEYEIFRGDLSRILYDLTKDDENVQYIFNEQISSLHQDSSQDEGEDGPIKVEFANDTPTTEYDLVVACDGATSRTRALGLGGGVRDHMYPTNCWAAYYSLPKEHLPHITSMTSIKPNEGLAHSAVEGKFMAMGSDPAGVTRVTLMSFAPTTTMKGDVHDNILAFREASRNGDAALKSFVAARFRDSGWIANTLIDPLLETGSSPSYSAMAAKYPPAVDFYASEISRVSVPRLFRGRFVMVGDAGYAPGSAGSGTTLAMTGAYLLAGELATQSPSLSSSSSTTSSRSVRAGLEGYEARMRPIIDALSKVPPFVPTVMAPQTAWGLWLRNLIFALVIRSGMLEFGQKYLAGAFAKREDYPLPEYKWKH